MSTAAAAHAAIESARRDDPHTGTFTIVSDALLRGTLTADQARECQAVSERLYGATDAMTIGYRRAIAAYTRG